MHSLNALSSNAYLAAAQGSSDTTPGALHGPPSLLSEQHFSRTCGVAGTDTPSSKELLILQKVTGLAILLDRQAGRQAGWWECHEMRSKCKQRCGACRKRSIFCHLIFSVAAQLRVFTFEHRVHRSMPLGRASADIPHLNTHK